MCAFNMDFFLNILVQPLNLQGSRHPPGGGFWGESMRLGGTGTLSIGIGTWTPGSWGTGFANTLSVTTTVGAWGYSVSAPSSDLVVQPEPDPFSEVGEEASWRSGAAVLERHCHWSNK
jgi:hypothetical protein